MQLDSHEHVCFKCNGRCAVWTLNTPPPRFSLKRVGPSNISPEQHLLPVTHHLVTMAEASTSMQYLSNCIASVDFACRTVSMAG